MIFCNDGCWPRINSAGRTRCEPGWHWDTRKVPWDDFDLWVVFGGTGEMHTPEGRFPLHRGVCFVLPGGRHYRAYMDPNDRLAVNHIHFDILRNGKRVPPAQFRDDIPIHRHMPNMDHFDGLLERVVNLCRRQDIAAAEHYMIAALLEVQLQDRQPRLWGRERQQRERLNDICAQISESPSASHRVDDWAKRCGYSPEHFGRLFKKHTGMSPSQYIIQSRIERARALLLYTSHSVGEIAAMLGYGDIHHFSRQFANKCGLSPQSFRKQSGAPAN